MDRASKSVWRASKINVGSDYKPGGIGMVVFGQTRRRIQQQGCDGLGIWSWMSFEGETTK